jgi:methylenetetrahydrofolate reductase (NADPH)
MPVLSAQRLRRILDLTAESTPVDLLRKLEAQSTAEGQAAVGIEHAVTLVRDVYDTAATADSAPGVHLYTFNRHEAVLEVLRGAGVFAVPADA